MFKLLKVCYILGYKMEVYKATCMIPALQEFVIETGKETCTLHPSQEEFKNLTVPFDL